MSSIMELSIATHVEESDIVYCNSFWPWYMEPECGDVWLRLERKGITMKILAKDYIMYKKLFSLETSMENYRHNLQMMVRD